MSEIDVILFDADGVVVFPWRFSRYLEEHHDITMETTREFFEGVFGNCLLGEVDLKEVLPPYLELWGWTDTVDSFVDIWLKTEDAVDDRMIEVMRSLQELGMMCGLVTNQEHYRAEYMRNEMGFEQIFDYLFFSSTLGCKKPEREYYKEITKALAVPAHRILFFDDSAAFVHAARKYGWKAEVYKSFESFEVTLSKYLGQME